jgi:serine/threonine-protein kinase
MALNNDGPRYYITRVIKQGGQGAVYETIGDDGKIYAVKEMLDRFTDPKERAEAIDRFETEAELLQHLTHPRIPRVYSAFKDEGRNYLAMDFVRGEDMEQLLQREGALPESQALGLAEQLCDVLDYLHRKGFIYRDMKPSNIMLDRASGGIKLVDFGIAKVFEPSNRGTQIGTPGYAPPEQYQGLATPASDIYALGATLHHMLTGRDPRDEKPFSFPSVHELKPSVSQRTAAAIAKALQMKADDRYHSAQAFWNDMRPQPVPPSQVRVAPATVALPAQPAVAAPAQPLVAPRTAAPAPVAAKSASARPPRTTPPVGTRLELPTQASTPATSQQPAQPVAPDPVRRFLRWLSNALVRLVIILVVLAALAGVLIWQAPQVVQPYGEIINRYIPGLVQTPPASVRLVPFSTGTIEVVVPPDQDVRTVFVAAYTQLAKAQHGADAVINAAALSYIGGEPQKVADEPGGARYRGEMTGFVQTTQP